MRGKSRGFFGLSRGALPPNFQPRVSTPAPEPLPPRRPAPPPTLTTTEWDLLNKYLDFYLALARGTRKPSTAAQRHFVAVCRGAARPETAHEVAFVKWRRGPGRRS